MSRTYFPAPSVTIHLGSAMPMLKLCLPSGWPYWRKLLRISSSVRALNAFVTSTQWSLMVWMVTFFSGSSRALSGCRVSESLR
jgi:hypothetical protein